MAFSKLLRRLKAHSGTAGEGGVNDPGLPVQTGALPWRITGGKRAEVLLVTGRRSGRWMIPTGWPMPGKTLSEAAAREAFEEAGVEGAVEPEPMGQFDHVKQGAIIGSLKVRILVHAMAVQSELADWPEQGQRERKWFKIKEAAEQVDSPELAAMILQLRDRLGTRPKGVNQP
jgi:8-oxo-dGTP pyrophosphatase MutT (NUDIX family)